MASLAARMDLPYRARFDECGADGDLRTSGFLRYAQHAAWIHSETAGFDRSWWREHGLTWLVRCVELDVMEGIEHGEHFIVSTEVTGWRRVWARRRSEFRASHRERVRATAIIDWVLLGAKGTPVRIPELVVTTIPSDGGRTFTPARVELPATPADADVRVLAVQPRDLDPLGHVNNAVYVDHLEEALDASGRTGVGGTEPRRLRVEYVAPAGAESRLSIATWRDGVRWCGRISEADGREVFRAVVETDPALWVGG